MKTKTTSNPLFTSLLAIAAACLSVGAAWTADAQSPTPTPTDLFASVNLGGTSTPGGGSIFRYTPDGIQSTFASNLDAPRGLAFDSDGNLFVANNSTDQVTGDVQGTILKITPRGLMSTFASFDLNFFLQAVVIDSGGNLFVMAQSDANGSNPNPPSIIFKVNAVDGTISAFGTNPDFSHGLAFDSAGNLFAANNGADIGDKTIYEYDPNGVQSTFVTNSQKFIEHGGPVGLAFDGSGNLFVSTEGGDDIHDAILKSTPGASPPETIIAAEDLNLPRGIAFDSAGNLFVAEVGNTLTSGSPPGDILKFTPDETGTTWTRTTFAPNIGIHGNRGAEYLAFAPPNPSPSIAPNVTMAVTLTSEATAPGTTTVTSIADPSTLGPLPTGIDPNDALAFEITTTATYATPIIIAVQLPLFGGTEDEFNQLKVLHWNSTTSVWDDVTCPIPRSGPIPDFTTKTIYASTPTLSPFVVAKETLKAQIQQPINANESSVFGVRRGVVPAKFTLTQDGTSTCALPAATIAVTRTAGGTTGSIDESVYSGPADTGSNFRISSCQYMYNLSASALGVGTYRADIKINGTVVGSGIFQLK